MSLEENAKNKRKPSDFSVGDKVNGNTIKKVYFYSDDINYIIIRNAEDELKYFANISVTEITPTFGECNFLRDMAHGKKTKEWIDFQRASALNEFFQGNIEKSIEILDKCMETIKQKEIARKKMIYIGVYLGITVLLLMISLILRMIYPKFEYMQYLYIALFGAFGGFISLNSRLEKVDFCISEGTLSYIVMSVYKMALACVSSIIAYLLIQSDMILTAVKDSSGVAYIVATVAGFSERLLPNIFAKIESDAVESE